MIETGATAGGCPHAPASELGPRGRVGELSRSGARRGERGPGVGEGAPARARGRAAAGPCGALPEQPNFLRRPKLGAPKRRGRGD